jgi:hypothetical protein
MAQSVQQLETGWMVQESNPGGGEIILTLLDRRWGLPSII